MKKSFISALWGVCCGTRVFPVLKGHGAFRTVWHLALMSLVCAALITWGGVGRAKSEYRKFVERYGELFGERLIFSRSGMRPEKDPDKPRYLALPGQGGLFYTAGMEKVEMPPQIASGSAYFVVWSDYCFIFGARNLADGDNAMWQIQVADPDRSIVVRKVSADKLDAFLDALLAERRGGGRWKFPVAKIGTERLFRVARRIVAVAVFFAEFVGIFLLALVCTALFAFVSRLTGAAALRGLGGMEYWKIGVYAGFPGMLIGAVAEALDLPFLVYGMVYAFALVIYWPPASLACAAGRRGDGDDAPRT